VTACLVATRPAMALRVVSVVILFAFILAVNLVFYLPLKSESNTNNKSQYEVDATENANDKPYEFFFMTGSLQPEDNLKKVQNIH
jgi:hypothetical protein